jgi:lysophospholipase L1-like esterase
MSPRGKTPRIILCASLVVVNIALFLILEAGARVYVATQVGPRALLYGTSWHRSQQDLVEPMGEKPAGRESARFHRYKVGNYRAYAADQAGSYSKYFPNEIKTLRDTKTLETFPVRINAQGFRGDDFAVRKDPGVVRVLTLGASSTFGYGSRDHETYPHVLEEILNQRSGGQPPFEVINFAIPHATMDNIVAMFLAEGVELEPDVVTLYSGVNDSAISEEARGPLGRLWHSLRSRLLILEFVDHSLGPVQEPSLHLWNEEYRAQRSAAFLENVQTLAEECQKRNIHLIVATQQAKSLMVDASRMQGLAYAEEVDRVRRSVNEMLASRSQRGPSDEAVPPREPNARGDGIPARFRPGARVRANYRRMFLTHDRLMRDLRTWAASNGVDLVDVIELLDADRHLLVSWVHLHPEANRRVAEAFAERILEGRASSERAASTSAPAS